MRAIIHSISVAFILTNILADVIGTSGSETGMFCEDGICTRISNEPATNLCKDTNEDCRAYAADGECNYNPTFMHRTCPSSCRVCPSFACADENPDCEYWASQGECENNPNYMFSHCSISCGVCEDEDGYKDAYGSKPHCADSLEECSQYVSQGMCVSRQIFMMNFCGFSCNMCDALDVFNMCIGKRHPFNKPLFSKEGRAIDGLKTMDSFFESLKLDEKSVVITHPSNSPSNDESIQVTKDPYILQINNLLSPEKCENLIVIATNIGWQDSTVNRLDHFKNGSQSSQLPLRSSKSVKCEQSQKECQEAIGEIVSTLAAKTGIPPSHFEPDEIIHYPQGGYYSSHYNHRLSDEYKPAGPRVLTMNIILSEATSGGSFGFPELDWLLVNPNSRGSLLLWPNVDSDLNVDARMKNEIMPVREGDLYLLQMHVHLYDYMDSVEKGCA